MKEYILKRKEEKEKNKSGTHIHMRCSEPFKNAIKEKANSLGINITEYIIFLIEKDMKGDKWL